MLIIEDNLLTEDEVLRYSNFEHNWKLSNMTDPNVIEVPPFHEFVIDPKFQFVNVVKRFNFEQQPICSELVLLVERFAKKNNLEVLEILAMKFNLIVNNKTIKNKTNIPHVDFPKDFFRSKYQEEDVNHFVLLCYINDSDGPTVIYNEKDQGLEIKELSIKEKIDPKAGRAIFFEGDQYHSSSFPVNSNKRMVLNINIIGKINKL